MTMAKQAKPWQVRMFVTQALSGATTSNCRLSVLSIATGRPAAIDTGTAFVADLRLYPGKTGQTRNPVRAAHLSLIEKVVVQFAITVDLAALSSHAFRSWPVCRLSSLARLLSGFFSQV